MTRALFALLALSALGLCTGCRIGQGLAHHGHHGPACPDGCGHGCPDGACGHPHGHCDGDDGHSDPFEPFHLGHQGPPQRGGVLSFLGRAGGGGGPPANAQPAPGPSAGAVSYPYYTTRGPRDFLAADPRGIGPNF